MLKAITTVTSLTLVLLYLTLLLLTYPYVCWLKHRPSDDADHHAHPPTARVIKKHSTAFCSKTYALNLMPMPSKVIVTDGANNIRIPQNIRLVTTRSLPFPTLPSLANATFTLSIDYSLEMTNESYPDLGIDESYQLNITSDNRASLSAKTYVGVIRGLATFQQLQHQETVPVPLTIIDKPRFIWRGLMLDVARHFIPLSIVKQTINHMKLVKMNVLHLHLTDDQGFRLESKRFPRLHDSSEFYSQADMQDLIEYARQRAIRIVPEFDMPAHTAAWFVGYPHLASSQKSSYRVEKTWGVQNATMDVTRQTTYDFLDAFFAEMTQLFPDPCFHIGGDECEPYEWMQSEPIQQFIARQKLYNHQHLQAYFTQRVGKLLEKYNREYELLWNGLTIRDSVQLHTIEPVLECRNISGLLHSFLGTMMGWDEISAANLPHQSVIQSWRDRASLISTARRGYRAVLSHGFYLDHMAPASYHYSNDFRFDSMLDKAQQDRILGGEACLWTEYINADMADSRIWPRTAAIAEKLWSSRYDQIECMYDRLTHLDHIFFHPPDERYLKSFSKLVANATALKILADVCEPLGLFARDRKRNYTTHTALNRFVDLLRPESEQTRLLIKTTNVSILYATFVSWKMNKIYLDSNHSEILELSENLVRLGEIGIRLLKLWNDKQQRYILPARWYYYQLYVLNTLEYQVPEVRLAGVRVVKDLLEQFDCCAFDSVNLALILIFPLLIIVVQRVSFIRRRLLLPCLIFCFHSCARC